MENLWWCASYYWTWGITVLQWLKKDTNNTFTQFILLYDTSTLADMQRLQIRQYLGLHFYVYVIFLLIWGVRYREGWCPGLPTTNQMVECLQQPPLWLIMQWQVGWLFKSEGSMGRMGLQFKQPTPHSFYFLCLHLGILTLHFLAPHKLV